MGKVVKKVAPIAIGVGLGMATAGTSAPFQSAAWWKGTSAGLKGAFAGIGSAITSNPFQAAGLGLQTVGAIQQRKYATSQANYQRRAVEEQNKANEARNRYNQLLQRRSRLQAIRQARINQAAATGSMGNVLGQGGTSGLVGSIGSYGTQASTNLGNINVAEDVGNRISQFNTMSANYQSAANTAGSKSGMWSNMTTLGGNLMTQGPQIKNIFSME